MNDAPLGFFQAAYQSDLQSLYALLVVPIAFLAWRATRPTEYAGARVPEAGRFVSRLTLCFAVLTVVDPICTGPLNDLPILKGTFGATLVMFFFVLLGDFRVLFLVIGVARPAHPTARSFTWAAAATLIVPILTGVVYGLLSVTIEDLHGQWLWMIYEASFAALCIGLSRRWLPRTLDGDPARAAKTAFLREALAYSAAYYALWLWADILIVLGGLDLGWGVRIVPNQLYYALWTPFVYARFFSGPGASPVAGNAAR